MGRKSYTVTGMSCGHCAAGVLDTVSAVAGVREVTVDLAARTVVVDVVEGADVDDAGVRVAIAEAGYGVVGADLT
ncbi:Lead, cadmium, zinc and mercury-transporting ATPase [Streptomyces hundungensis]|uniref:Lead, cadmium, zinc and mercury-transporting ATPase n=1 Tax=Streptomyces hundungensis TaxID=1077946 RepID=A0A387HT25_9ACTN|nr:heavy-metal-associated domain-containing protein [Streptomyces hundungensis]AYG85087.1 Lead, cadmium, zinc and mercury-transporting ATPase [Streptomyces hundungensis]